MPFLERIFQLEWQSFGIAPPTLIIDEISYPGKTVYFDFDPEQPSSGTVYLHPSKISKMGPYAALAFLIHETRHSYQFQLANAPQKSVLQHHYWHAFKAQKAAAPGTLSFADFLTLVNEYEAFQFGNYVVNNLTEGKFNQDSMGTFASQFDETGSLKIDLPKLFHEQDNQQNNDNSSSHDSVLARFNQAQQAQKALLSK